MIQAMRSLSMRTQLLLLVLTITIIILGIAMLLCWISNIMAMCMLRQASNEIYLRSSANQMQSKLHAYSNMIKSTMAINSNQLITMNRLYLGIQSMVEQQQHITINHDFNMNYSGTRPIPKSIQSLHGYGKLQTSYSFLCYSNYTSIPQNQNRTELIGIKIQEQLQAYGQIFYQEKLTRQSFDFGFIDEFQYFIIYPCLNRGQTIYSYVPQTRQWYIDGKSAYSKDITDYKTILSDPYLLYTEQSIGLSLVMPIIGRQRQFLGVWATILVCDQFKTFESQSGNEIAQVMLVNSNGVLLIHTFNVTYDQLPIRIYDGNITGFNHQDWNEITNSSGQSNCDGFVSKYNLICRYNTLYMRDIIIGVDYFIDYNIYMIVIHDSHNFYYFQQEQDRKISEDFKSFIFNQIRWFLIIFIGSLISIVAMLYWIMYPIMRLVNQSNAEIFKRAKLLSGKSIVLKAFSSNTLQQLKSAFAKIQQQLHTLQLRKTDKCKLLEQVGYPVNSNMWPLDEQITQIGITMLKIQIMQLPNKVYKHVKLYVF